MSAVDPVILDALAQRLLAAQAAVPAGLLAAEFGCSRAGLAQRVETLRSLGAAVATTSEGYALDSDDRLDAAEIRRALPASSPLAVGVKQVCDSTNLAVRAHPVPALCVAELQLCGRGRRGRQWAQPFGTGLLMSLSVKMPGGRLDALAIALAMAALECLEAMGQAGLFLKWPNDFMCGGAKLGGLMIEAEGGRNGRLCVGLGINVRAAPELPGRGTTSLAELGRPPSRNLLAARIAQAFLETLDAYAAEGFAPFAARFPRYDWLLDRPVTLYGASSGVEGIARGVDGSGALILETGQGRKLFYAGEATLSRAVEEAS
ncbi:MAG: biotin--[acetyl-CoA-carboxylase] ligase [Gammaproteobacteria bacterium]|nr:biotin--[acetyl-CoA-carboxylase] ligase [Gammaproteobacteria bacterium]